MVLRRAELREVHVRATAPDLNAVEASRFVHRRARLTCRSASPFTSVIVTVSAIEIPLRSSPLCPAC